MLIKHIQQQLLKQPTFLVALLNTVKPFVRTYNGEPEFSNKYEEETQGQHLLDYWNHLLHRVASGWPDVKTEYSEDQVRQLIHAAMRYRRSRYMFPEQFVSTLMNFYDRILPPDNRAAFFRLLSVEFGVANSEVEECVDVWKQVRESDRREALLRCNDDLHEATRPIYNSLWAPISQQPGGIRFLVKMREHLLDAIQEEHSTAQDLRQLSEHIRYHLADWFSLGLLSLEEVDWDKSTASLLEKAIGYEVIHPMNGWEDLKKRFGPNRRVYAFSHLVFPEEPLVLLYVALSDQLESNIDSIINTVTKVPESECKVGIFYSIQTTQPGLAGIDLGHLMIKEVANKLLQELPNVETLVTLSPIPNFRNWLMPRLHAELLHMQRFGSKAAANQQQMIMSAVGFLIKPEEVQNLCQIASEFGIEQANHNKFADITAMTFLYNTLQGTDWITDTRLNDAIRPVLMRLCAHYLLREKRRSLALDPVANFHLRNGAWMHRLNWMADMKQERVDQSWGIMVNYKYVVADVHTNNRVYLVDNAVMASSEFRQSLLN
eukprot:TRINITY_DN5742_c0_g3_i1.p1 TRINITY_DN5742_c0_g3~~TRINITY_DN5742_c0_g3_i1.p1  ORF type:complete len:554 (-),score=88.69 TRINITY_DN5742_c0_g3_i1:364-2001(-)